MALEEKLTAIDIVNEAGMDERPEYYSGRGATLTDLTPKHLQKIHGLINKEHGEEAAQNFVEMIANMKDLAASNFLTCLYHLEAMGWRYGGFQSDLAGGVAIAKNRDGRYNTDSGIQGILAAIHSRGRDETEEIRQPFLEDMGYKRNPRED
jgi:hypothetical protein